MNILRSNYSNKVPKEDKDKIEKSLEELKNLLKDEKAETAALKEKTDALIQNSMKLGEIMYKEAQEKAEKEKKASEDSGKGKADTKAK